MSGKSARRKGHQYERDVANKYKAAGCPDARRGYQAFKGEIEPDVAGIPGWWISCKCYGKGSGGFNGLMTQWRQLLTEKGAGIPLLHVKQTNGPELVVLTAEEWFRLWTLTQSNKA